MLCRKEIQTKSETRLCYFELRSTSGFNRVGDFIGASFHTHLFTVEIRAGVIARQTPSRKRRTRKFPSKFNFHSFSRHYFRIVQIVLLENLVFLRFLESQFYVSSQI